MFIILLSTVNFFILVALEDSIQSGLADEGPDSAYVQDIDKFLQMKRWLDTEKVLLLRSPPGSGKTSFAVHFAAHLRQNGFSGYYFNAAQLKNRVTKDRSLDDIWKHLFGLTFWEFCEVPMGGPTYIIMDEAQTWYPANAAPGAKGELDAFWSGVKTSFKQAQEWTNHVAGLGFGNLGLTTASSPVTVRLLCLAGYGEAKLGVVATPLEFMDPVDPDTQLRLPLGLNVLRLDRDKTNEVITKFVDIKNSEGKMTPFSLNSDVRDLIFNHSNGHVGVIRTLLFHLVSPNNRTGDDILNFFSRSIYQSNLGGYRTFLPAHEDTIRTFSPLEMALLVQCIVAYKRGEREVPVIAEEASRFIKLGLFIKSSETTFSGQTTLAFPSPLHFDLVLYTVLHRKMELYQNRECFEQALKEMVLRMSPKLLQDTTPIDHLPYECEWQDECCTSFRAMARRTITPQYGRQYNQCAYLDLYVDDLQWGIELIRQGGGKRLEEHVEHFCSIDGRYRNIPMQEYAVLNFTNEVPNDATLGMYDHVWHLVYNEMYTQVTVHRKNKPPTKWDLIGYQSCHEY